MRVNSCLKVIVEKYLTSLGILRTEANQTFDLWCGQFERRALAHDLPAAWNAPTAEPRTKQRLKVRVDHVDVVLMPAEFASALAERPN